MPTAQELKRACEALNAQIAGVEQEEREAQEARLWAKEEAWVATEKASREEEEWEQEEAWLAKEARAWAEEEAWAPEEEERVVVE